MSDQPVPGLAATLLILVLIVGLAAVIANVWPVWASCTTLAVVLVGAWWWLPRETRTESSASPTWSPGLSPDETARRAAVNAVEEAAWRAEEAEHERVEAALRAILDRDGVRCGYRGPMGGHMDKRDGTYVLSAPLPVTADDLVALSGPLTRFGLATAGDGGVLLRSLHAHDRHFGGIEVVLARR